MTYFHLPTGTERHPGNLERKVSDGAMIGAPGGRWTPELAAVCGFLPVQDDPPAPVDGFTFDRHIEIIAGVPVAVYTERAAAPAPPQPLDRTGALAALLVVAGQLDLDDAANAVGVTPDALVTEAQAWAVAANP